MKHTSTFFLLLLLTLLSFTSCGKVNRAEYNPLESDIVACRQLIRLDRALMMLEDEYSKYDFFVHYCRTYLTDQYDHLTDEEIANILLNNGSSYNMSPIIAETPEELQKIKEEDELVQCFNKWYKKLRRYLSVQAYRKDEEVIKKALDHFHLNFYSGLEYGDELTKDVLDVFQEYYSTYKAKNLNFSRLLGDDNQLYQVWIVGNKEDYNAAGADMDNYLSHHNFAYIYVFYDENDNREFITLRNPLD